jgi:hypothetical protein
LKNKNIQKMGFASKLQASSGYVPYQGNAQPIPVQQPVPVPFKEPNMKVINDKINSFISIKKLKYFFKDDTKLPEIINKLSKIDFAKIADKWRIKEDLAYDFCLLALYDVVFYVDDSGSMQLADNGERIEDLKAILTRIVDLMILFDDDGVSIRFMNSNLQGNNIKTSLDIHNLISKIQFNGGTPMGTSLDQKILKPLILSPASNKNLKKPVLIITITDGEPTGEDSDTFRRVVKSAAKFLDDNTKYGKRAVAFQLAQVGKDSGAQRFLSGLDDDKSIGKLIDATSYYEMEQEEWKKKGIDLTPELWLLKLCLGAIDPKYDQSD